jgi:superfamily II DNA/RNA helicase
VRVPFDSAHRAATHQELIDAGHISEIEVRDVRIVDRARIVLPGRAQATPEAIDAIWKSEGHLHEVVEPTIRLASTRPTIVFTPTIERAEQMAAMFNRYRPDTAAAISGQTPRPIRAGIIEQFEARNLQYLVNVGVLGRGVDFPFVSCIVMARVTHSRTVYEQAIGRGWRAHPGKQRLLVLDFCENSERHRLLATFALLTGRDVDEEVLERARERIEENDGGEIGQALDDAQRDLMDPEVRKRIRASVAVRTRTVDLLTDTITEEDWRTKTVAQIAKETGVSEYFIRCRRPSFIPRRKPSSRIVLSHLSDGEWAQKTDIQIADQYGVNYWKVRLNRPKHIRSPAHKNAPEVSDDEWRTVSNAQLAERYGFATIARYRPSDIPNPKTTHPGSKYQTLTSSITEADWKNRSNRALAATLGVGVKVIVNARPQHIPSPGRAQEVLVSEDEWRTLNNREIGKLKGVHYLVIRDRRPAHIPSPGVKAKPKKTKQTRSATDKKLSTWVVHRDKSRSMPPVACGSCLVQFSKLTTSRTRNGVLLTFYCSPACKWREQTVRHQVRRRDYKRRRRVDGHKCP